MSSHSFLDQLDESLRQLRDPLPVRFAGQWSSAARRTYQAAAASRGVTGRLADVVDLRWQGELSSDERVGAVTFLLTEGDLHWAKSPQMSSCLGVDLSLHAYADFQPTLATFTAGVGGAWLPGVATPVAGSSLAGACVVQEGAVTTGRVACIARAGSAAVFVVLLAGELLEVGRKRIWRIRDTTPFAAYPEVEALLTRGRTGTARVDPTPRAAE